MNSFVRWITIASLAALAGCATSTAPPPQAEQEEVGFSDAYRIGVGDTLQINVWRNEDLSVEVPVRPDGKVSVPLAGDVFVGNRTPEEVSASITETLSTYIRDPFVTVIVVDMGSDQFRSRVRVTGAVEEPSSLPFRQGMTVLLSIDPDHFREFLLRSPETTLQLLQTAVRRLRRAERYHG